MIPTASIRSLRGVCPKFALGVHVLEPKTSTEFEPIPGMSVLRVALDVVLIVAEAIGALWIERPVLLEEEGIIASDAGGLHPQKPLRLRARLELVIR